MSMPIPFDTIRYTRRLSAAGIPQEQAEAHASALAEVLKDTPVAVDSDMALLKADILARVQEMLDVLEERINRRLNVMQMVLVALTTVSVVHISITLVVLAKVL
jgi:hypothetical protein